LVLSGGRNLAVNGERRQERGHFGGTHLDRIGYGVLESALDLSRNAEYQAARGMMMRQPVPSATEYEGALGNLGEGLAEVVPLMDRLAELFEGYEVAKYDGSYSIKERGYTIAKILPRWGGVFVGIRDSKRPEHWFLGALKSITIQGVVFGGVVVQPGGGEQTDAERLVRGLRPA
jgi:hypothetical protein